MLNSHDIATVLFDIGILLGFSRFLGEVARRYRQPMVVGEILAGILLGPTVFGALAPEIQRHAFPLGGGAMNALEGMTTVALVLLLLVAGMEINLSSVWKQGRIALFVSVFGIIVPFALGFGTSWIWPRFLGFIGLQVNFASNFNALLVFIVFVLACAGKIIGCSLGARWGGLSVREALAVGFGMNARGAMEIILGLLALKYGLIQENLFVALVVMALGTSMISGPVMEWILREKKPLKLVHLLRPSGFAPSLKSTTREDVIMELAKFAARRTGIGAARIFDAVWTREKIMGTALGKSVAVPHARLIEISAPVVIAGLSREGIDFNAIDGAPARLIFMLLTPSRDDGAQLQILADIARVFSNSYARYAAMRAGDYETFMQAITPSSEHPQK